MNHLRLLVALIVVLECGASSACVTKCTWVGSSVSLDRYAGTPSSALLRSLLRYAAGSLQGTVTPTPTTTPSEIPSYDQFVCASASEGANAALTCPSGEVIKYISTAWYGWFTFGCTCGGTTGSSTGPCPISNGAGTCTCATCSTGVCPVPGGNKFIDMRTYAPVAACVGQNSCSVSVSGCVNGNNPCQEQAGSKTLLITAACGPPSVYVCGSCTDSSCSASTALVTCPASKVISKIVSATYGVITANSCTCSAYPGTSGVSAGPCSISGGAGSGSCSVGTCCTNCGSATTGQADVSTYYETCVGYSSCSPLLLCDSVLRAPWEPCQGHLKTLLLEVQCDNDPGHPVPLTPTGTYVCGSCTDSTCSAATPIVTCPSGMVIGDIVSATYGALIASKCTCSSYTGSVSTSVHGPCSVYESDPTCACGPQCDACPTTGLDDISSYYRRACIGHQTCSPEILCNGFWGRHDPCHNHLKTLVVEAHCVAPSITPSISKSPVVNFPTYVCGACSDTTCSTATPVVTCPVGEVILTMPVAVYGGIASYDCSCGYPGTAPTTACTIENAYSTSACPFGTCCGACGTPVLTDMTSYYTDCIGQRSCAPKNLCSYFWGPYDPCEGVVKTLLLQVTCGPAPTYVCGSCTENGCTSSTPLVTCPAGKVVSRIVSATYGLISTSGCTCTAYPGTYATSSTACAISLAPGATAAACGVGLCCSSCGSAAGGLLNLIEYYDVCVGFQSCAPLNLCNGFWGPYDPCHYSLKNLLLEVECDNYPDLPLVLVPTGVYVCGSCTDATCSTSTPLVTCPAGMVIGNIVSATYGSLIAAECSCGSYTGTTSTSLHGPCNIYVSYPACACGVFCDSCTALGTTDVSAYYQQACVGVQTCFPLKLCNNFWAREDPCHTIVKTLLLEAQCVSPSRTPTVSKTPNANTPVYVCGSCTDATCRTTTNLVTCPSGKTILSIVAATYGMITTYGCTCSSYPGTAPTSACTIQNSFASASCTIGTSCGSPGASVSIDEHSQYQSCVGQPGCAPKILCSNFWGPYDPCSGQRKTLLLQVLCG